MNRVLALWTVNKWRGRIWEIDFNLNDQPHTAETSDVDGDALHDPVESKSMILMEELAKSLKIDIFSRLKASWFQESKVGFGKSNFDNVNLHAAKQTLQKLKKLKWDTLQHPPYSTDLDPSDFYWFRSLRKI